MARKRRNSGAADDGVPRLILSDKFPVEFLSGLAERESWRKEVYRPIYHIHKWWAKRLGSVFRGILLGCLLPADADLEKSFYESHAFSGAMVLDPFMGSGTTVGEAHKLGCTALGRDINPVACESVRVALGPLDETSLIAAFEHLSATVGQRIRNVYRALDDKQRLRDVLYYFWVKQVVCPWCHAPVDLFSTRILARNAYPHRKPDVQLCCPGCSHVFGAPRGDQPATCPSCGLGFHPRDGTVSGSKATCSTCARSFSVVDAVRREQRPPAHRLYAKLLLYPDGTKRYLAACAADHLAYDECRQLLRMELEQGSIRLPTAALNDGYNTRQALGYNYRCWRDFFNDRQLLALGWLQDAIAELPEPTSRDALFMLFSGILEFNNMFASYKGEGTGAVRHMFSHHILKPERMPIEANVWGTPKSSGSFRNLFASRLLRALGYRSAPFEVKVRGKGKVYSAAEVFSGRVSTQWPTAGDTAAAEARTRAAGAAGVPSDMAPAAIYLSCGSSEKTGLLARCVDLVVTDPPFFDNVHYSELADFFHAWESLYPRGFVTDAATTRDPREVQDTIADRFAAKLGYVLSECCRVLKDQGLLVFTYHHSRPEGWTSLVQAIYEAGFAVAQAHPVKAEMSVATPKSLAKDPIQLDVIFVCQKRPQDAREPAEPSHALRNAALVAEDRLKRLQQVGLALSQNDCRVTVISQFLAQLGPVASPQAAVDAVRGFHPRLDEVAAAICDALASRVAAPATEGAAQQLTLF